MLPHLTHLNIAGQSVVPVSAAAAESSFADMAQVPNDPFRVSLVSPPYMSDEPEMVVRDLVRATGERLQFLILASDGCECSSRSHCHRLISVWDGMTANEAVLLVAAHMDQPVRDDVRKARLAEEYRLVDLPDVGQPYQGEPLPNLAVQQAEGVWSFRDENAALHLLRNSLGHGDEWVRRRLLSLRGDAARQYRDDTTVM